MNGSSPNPELGLADVLCDAERLALREADRLVLALGDVDAEADRLALALGEVEAEGESVGETEDDAEREGDTDAEADCDADTLGLRDDDGDVLALAETDGLRELLGLTLAEGDTEAEAETDGLTLALGDVEALALIATELIAKPIACIVASMPLPTLSTDAVPPAKPELRSRYQPCVPSVFPNTPSSATPLIR